MISTKRLLIAIVFAALAVMVSCLNRAQDPLVSVAEKYNAGSYVSLGDYYRESTGVKLAVKGVVIEVDQADAKPIMDAIKSDYVNVMPFRIEKNYGSGGKKDRLAVIKAMDQFQLVAALKTCGKEDKVANASIVKALQGINAIAKIRITGAGADFVEFTFAETPSDWGAVARECASIAPNIVTFGTGSIEKLETEMAKINGAVLWWY